VPEAERGHPEQKRERPEVHLRKTIATYRNSVLLQHARNCGTLAR